MTYTPEHEARLRELVRHEAALEALAGEPVCQRCGAPRSICRWVKDLIAHLQKCHGVRTYDSLSLRCWGYADPHGASK